MANRINGQIWIDKNSPYRLKYYTEGSEYEVNVSQIFEGDSDEAEELSMGMVVAVTDKGKLKRAVFPDDIERVIGVLGSKRRVDDPDGSYHYNVSISVADKLELSKEDVANSFVDIYESISKAGNAQNLLGAPIYWFIGRQKKNGDTYTYEDSNNYKGMVTFNTPSGYQWGKKKIDEDCFNIGYDNLPIIGTVSNIKYSNGTVTSLTLNTNYHGFDKTIGWSFPYTDNAELSRGVLTPVYEDGSYSASIDIRHGLFPNSPTVKARCYCDVIAMDYPNEDPEQTADTEYRVSAIVDNFYDKRELESASGNRHTHIEVHTPYTYRYNIHGTVVYKFQKGVN